MAKQDDIIESLGNLGLSAYESRVYLAMLSLGPSTILNISKASEIKRTTIYNILASLGQKGLVRVDIRGFKKLYAPEHPRRLESMLEMRKNDLKDLYPELEGLFNLKGEESFIKYYEGAESIKNAHFQLLAELKYGDEFLVVGDPDRWESINQNFGANFIKRRNKLGLHIRMMLVDSETGRKYKKFEQNFSEEIKLLPKDSKLVTNLVVTPRKMLIQEMISPSVLVIIENKSIINMHIELFNVMWRNL
jgi:sugar-specific transcriptional regulator TrmB